jgi:hypothetical protein
MATEFTLAFFTAVEITFVVSTWLMVAVTFNAILLPPFHFVKLIVLLFITSPPNLGLPPGTCTSHVVKSNSLPNNESGISK